MLMESGDFEILFYDGSKYQNTSKKVSSTNHMCLSYNHHLFRKHIRIRIEPNII